MQRDEKYERENFIYDKQSIGDDYYVIKCKNLLNEKDFSLLSLGDSKIPASPSTSSN